MQGLFGDHGESVVSDKKTFSQLLTFLSSLVPFDSPQCLTVSLLYASVTRFLFQLVRVSLDKDDV